MKYSKIEICFNEHNFRLKDSEKKPVFLLINLFAWSAAIVSSISKTKAIRRIEMFQLYLFPIQLLNPILIESTIGNPFSDSIQIFI